MRRIISAGMVLAVIVAGAAFGEDAFDAATASLEEILQAAFAAQVYDDAGTVESLLATADERFPGSRDVAEFRLTQYYRAGDFEAALALLDGWLADHPDDVEWVYVKATVLGELGRDDDALAALDDLISRGGAEADVYFEKADIYVGREPADYNSAAAAFEKGLAMLDAEDRASRPDVLYNLACSYARLGDEAKALSYLGEAFAAEPLYVRGARDDEDLASLAGDAAFETLIARAKAAAAQEEVNYMTVKPGEAAPAFTLPGIDGKEYSLGDYGGQYVFLNIWATWCGPCRNEIPDIVKFAQDHEGEVAVLSISVDQADADVPAFAEEYGINYPVLRDDGVVADQYISATGGIPQTYFIDKEGLVRGHIYGSADRAIFEEKLGRLVGEGDE